VRFSIYLNAQSRGPEDDAPIIDAVTEQALLADRSGFLGVCLTEHHFTGYNTYGNPFVFGAFLAPQLTNLHVVLSIAVPGLQNPMNFAEGCNLLDMLTKGRCVIGVGTGGSPQEYKGLGRDPGQRGQLMEEVLDIAGQALAKTLDDPDLPYETQHSSGVLTRRIMPTSFTKPGPRFARATLSDEGVISTAKRGWAMMTARDAVAEIGRRYSLYFETLEAAGHDAQVLDHCRTWTMTQKLVLVGETDEEAMRLVKEPLDNLAEQSRRSFNGQSAEAAGFRNSIVGVSAVDRDDFLEKAMIVGSPATVAAKIAQYQAVGVEHMTFAFLYGWMDPTVGRRSLQLFIDDVMPQFGGAMEDARRVAISSVTSS
jgi:alkanesulfonate monooxygenase SsuD/methylene tetrahydromethanopterin reductase-like flavin-dependent oxidoreductase (luciferase family)